jgi:lysophospholipid acyltransferase (LPLAT)-like uncharacterized protein
MSEVDSSHLRSDSPLSRSDVYSLRDRILFLLAENLGPLVINALGRLCHYQVIGFEHYENAVRDGRGVILALWHGRMLLPVYHLRGRGIYPLVSLHRDGELIARVVRKLGYDARRGSPREGGLEGFRALLTDLKRGSTIAIMPDGPTGPRHSIHDGVIHLARLSGAPIIPLTHSSNPRWIAKSWDKFNVNKPFSKGVVVFGEPLTISRQSESGKDLTENRDRVRGALIEVEVRADRMMGFPAGELV